MRTPTRIRTALVALEKALVSAEHHAGADTFSRVYNRFLDLTMDPCFLGLGRRTKDQHLLRMIALIVEERLGREARLTNVALVELPDADFVHGALLAGGIPAAAFYFPKLKQGLLALLPPGGESCLLRLTVLELASSPFPVRLAPGPPS